MPKSKNFSTFGPFIKMTYPDGGEEFIATGAIESFHDQGKDPRTVSLTIKGRENDLVVLGTSAELARLFGEQDKHIFG